MRKVSAIIALAALLALSGCYNAREIDDQGYIINFGVDFGEKERLRLTVELPAATGGNSSDSGNGGKSGPYEVIQAEGSSISECIDILNASTPKWLAYLNIKQIIISEEVARSDQFAGISKDIMTFYAMRHTAYFIICRGKASDFIDGQETFLGMRLSKVVESAIHSFIANSYIPSCVFISSYDDFVSTTRSAVAIYSAVSSTGDLDSGKGSQAYDEQPGSYFAGDLPNKLNYLPEYFGSAVFDNEKMVLALTGYQTQLNAMLRGQFKSGLFKTQGADGESIQIAARSVQSTRVSVNLDEEYPVIDVDIYLEGSIYQLLNDEDMETISERMRHTFQEDITELIRIFQKNGVDPAGFGAKAARKFLTVADWEEYGWFSKFSEAQISVNVHFLLREQHAALDYSR